MSSPDNQIKGNRTMANLDGTKLCQELPDHPSYSIPIIQFLIYNLNMSIEAIIFYILFIDAVSANLMVMFGREWYVHHFRTFSRWFPPASGWALYYLVLILWVGSLMQRAGALFF